MSVYETDKSYIIITDPEEKLKDLFVYADFGNYFKICVPKNKLTKYIIKNEKYVLKLLSTVEDIKKNNIKHEEGEVKEHVAPRWDNSRDGLKYPWVIFKESNLETTLTKDFLILEELIITNLLEYIERYEIKKFENTETIKIKFILKKDTEFVKDLPSVRFVTNLKTLFEKLS